MKNSILTSLLLIVLLVACGRSEQPAAVAGEPLEFRCKEPLPVFTLGEKSKPTPEQVTNLCACIWNNLGNRERSASEKIAAGKEAEVSEMDRQALAARFGGVLEKCGGMKL